MSQEIKDQVTETLKGINIVFSATYRGIKRGAWCGEADMDEWLCSFNGTEFAYFMGLANRAPATKAQKLQAELGFQGLNDSDKKGLTNYGKRYLAKVESLRKPQAPHATEVLYSLILDSAAGNQSFSSWCSDFGYDEDSRKAFAIYTTCQENADKLNLVFKGQSAALNTITELLQEY